MTEQINQTEENNTATIEKESQKKESNQQQVIATVIDLDSCDIWERASVELKTLFEKNRTFWGKAPLMIRFANFLFTEDQSNELKNLITQFELNVVAVQTNSIRSWKYLRSKGFEVNAIPAEEQKETGETTSQKSNIKVSHNLTTFRESFKNAIPKHQEEEELFTPIQLDNALPYNAIEIKTAYVHSDDNIALRSGQRVVYDGNLVIFGDTNPGCQIFATGSIIVYGKLCGNVHAGWNVTDEAQLANIYIKALLMGDPLQVNIGKYSACSSDEQKKFVKKHKIYPETARVVDNQIWRFPDFT